VHVCVCVHECVCACVCVCVCVFVCVCVCACVWCTHELGPVTASREKATVDTTILLLFQKRKTQNYQSQLVNCRIKDTGYW